MTIGSNADLFEQQDGPYPEPKQFPHPLMQGCDELAARQDSLVSKARYLANAAISAPQSEVVETPSWAQLLKRREEINQEANTILALRKVDPEIFADSLIYEKLPVDDKELGKCVTVLRKLDKSSFEPRLAKLRQHLQFTIHDEAADLLYFIDETSKNYGPRTAFITGALLRNDECRQSEATYEQALKKVQYALVNRGIVNPQEACYIG